MNGATTAVLTEIIKHVEKRRDDLERAGDLRSITVTVTFKTGVVPPVVRWTTTNIECGGS